MQIGIMQISLVGDDLGKSFDLAARAGLDGLEITCDTPAELDAMLGADGIARVQQLKKKHKVDVPSIGLGIHQGQRLSI